MHLGCVFTCDALLFDLDGVLVDSAELVERTKLPRATAHRLAGQLQDALALYSRVAAQRSRVLGPAHPDTLISRLGLGLARADTGTPIPGGWHTYPEMAAAGLWTNPSELARVVIELEFIKPFPATNTATFSFVPGPEGREILRLAVRGGARI